MHGANRLAGNALAEIFSMGGIAGRNGAIYAKESGAGSVPESQIAKERERLEGLFSQDGENPTPLIRSLKKMMWLRAGVVRSSEDLKKALARIEEIRSGSRECKIETPKDLMLSIGLQNMLILSEGVCRSALLRTESRGSHFRSDFPQEDNANWLQNIVIRKGNDEMMVDKQPVKLDYVSPE